MKKFNLFSNIFFAICWGLIAIVAWGNCFEWWTVQFTELALPIATTMVCCSKIAEATRYV